jgi:hypothetical protein
MTRLASIVQSDGEGRKWSYYAIMVDKLQRLGIPFIVFTIIAMLMKTLFPGDMSRPAYFTVGEFLHAVLFPREGPLLEMWFVAVILWLFALTPYWCICLRSQKLSITTLVILFLCNIGIEYLPFGTFLCLRDTAQLSVYFFIGMLASRYAFDIKYEALKYRIIAISTIIYIGCQLINFSFGVAMSGIAFSVGLAFIFEKYCPTLFSSFRNYTYQIFLMSIFVQIAVKIIYKRIALMEIAIHYPIYTYVLFFLICLILGLYVPVIVSKIAEKWNRTPILLSIGLKKK